MDIRVNLSSCVPATPSRPPARGSRSPTSMPFRDHQKVIGLAEVMNFPGVLAGDPGMHRQARGLPGRPYRRPRAAAARHGAQRLSRRRHPHRPRSDHRRRSAREARARAWRILIREGSVSQGPRCAGRGPRREHLELCGALHRRPQSARHRRGRPSRLHDPPADRARAGRCTTSIAPPATRRPASSGSATAASSRRAGAPTSCCSTISKDCRVSDVICRRAAGAATSCSRRASRSRRSASTSMKAQRRSRPTISSCRPTRAQRDAGDRRARRARSSPSRESAMLRRSATGYAARSRARRDQGRGDRAARHERQYRPRLRPRLRAEARRHRLLGRP